MRELPGRVLAQRPGRVVALGSQGEHEEHRRRLREPEQLLQQEHRRRVRPVQVLDREHERPVLGEALEELPDDLERPPLQGLRRQLGGPRRGLPLEREVEQRAEIGVELGGRGAEELLEAAAEAEPHAQLGLVGAGADPRFAQEVPEGGVRQRLAVRDAPPLEPPHGVALRERPQLEQQAALADTGLPADDEHAAAAGA